MAADPTLGATPTWTDTNSASDDYDSGAPNAFTKFTRSIGVKYQLLLDKWTPHARSRWIFAVSLIILFMLRIIFAQGWYIITYALGIYHLNLFIAFLTPKIDPALDYEDDGLDLPTRSTQEFRPFIRRLPEFKFWLGMVKSTLIGLFCTIFDCFNVPVFWPILVMYFITLFCITMKRQIKHMIKYKYIPFTHGKPKYQHPPPTTS
ncbi:protein RER1 [Folsomia candida]|uniref:protein RER1 n=1 Tax=Folsomia candida TaxID=158441 RepID=UPI000B8F8DA9|nr:protein RER1 [Folsomia candida]